MSRLFLALGTLTAGLGVALGAFAAHGLEGILSVERLSTFQTGVQYQLFHALGLIAVGLSGTGRQLSPLLHAAGWSMFSGIILFAGSLYLLAFTGVRWFGLFTPIGGILFIIAWMLFFIYALRLGAIGSVD